MWRAEAHDQGPSGLETRPSRAFWAPCSGPTLSGRLTVSAWRQGVPSLSGFSGNVLRFSLLPRVTECKKVLSSTKSYRFTRASQNSTSSDGAVGPN